MRGVLAIHGVSGGGSTPSIGGTITGGTAGSVLFVGPGPIFAQDNANFFWDDSNNYLGIGTTAPASQLEIRNASTDPTITLRPNASGRQYTWSANDSSGHMRWARSDVSDLRIFFNPSEQPTFGFFSDNISTTRAGLVGANIHDFYIYTCEGGTSKNVIFGKRITDNVELNNNFEFWGGANKGNIGLGFSSFPTGRYVMYLGDGTAPGSLSGSNVVAIYADDSGGTVQLYTKNEADEVTQITGRTSAYTLSNVTTDRSYNANSTTLDEIADVLGTLIADLQTRGILG